MVTSMRKELGVGIVGGGISGLAAAIFLRRDGHRVTLFERAATLHSAGTGILLQPAGLDVLRRLGLEAGALARGFAIERVLAQARTGATILELRYAGLAAGGHALGIRRPALAAVLLEAARDAGTVIRFAAPVDAMREEDDGVELLAAGESAGRFDLALVCDGLGSRLRAQIEPARVKPHAFGVYSVVVPMPAGLATNTLVQRLDGVRDAAGLLPIGRDSSGSPLLSFFWNARERDVPRVEGAGFEAWTRRIETFCPEAREFLPALGAFAKLTYYKTAEVRMPRWHRARLLVMGDAAHALDPHLGLGATMALLDAEMLAQCMRESPGDVPVALGAYESRRRRGMAPYSRVSRVWSTLDHAGLVTLRRRMFHAAARGPRFMRQRMLRYVSGY
jgi:2-polyprenyl-6-methoxyphenol hydroxylase-like FAD-dependent oxidoreductase